MISDKLFYIEEARFNLPDDFTGTTGEALMLLAKYRLEQESKNKKIYNIEETNCVIYKDNGEPNMYHSLLNNNKTKASLAYSFLKLDKEQNVYTDIRDLY